MLAVCCLGVAGAIAWALLEIIGNPLPVLQRLVWWDATWLAVLLVAPAVLLVAALARRRTPWPWVAAEICYLAALGLAVSRAHEILDASLLVWAAVTAVLAVASVVAALRADPIVG